MTATKSLLFIAAAFLSVGISTAYTAEDREKVLVDVIDAAGFPRLEAFNRMTPKMLKTVMGMYSTSMGEDAFEHFNAKEIEVIYTAVSAANNCELCLSFHAMTLGEHERNAADIKEIGAGGLPKDEEMRKLVVASKFALAHKGIYLEREKIHLASMDIKDEKLVELNFLVGFMSAFNFNYIHLVSNGLEMEEMLQVVGPFADTVYSNVKSEL